jgi:hypothetical protein
VRDDRRWPSVERRHDRGYPYADGLTALDELIGTREKLAGLLAGMAPPGLGTMIDIGSADGGLAVMLARRLPEVRRWVLVDLDGDLLARSLPRLRDRTTGEVAGIAADMDLLPMGPLPRSTAVVLAHVLYYSADWQALLRAWAARKADLLMIVMRSAYSCSYQVRNAVRRTGGPGLTGETVLDVLLDSGTNVTVSRIADVYRTGIHRRDLDCGADQIRSLLASRPGCARLLSLWCHAHPADLDDDQLLSLRACLLEMIQGDEVVFVTEDVVIGCHASRKG